MRLTIGYVNNPNNTRQCTWEEFLNTIFDQKVIETCKKLAAIPYDAEHREERQALKKKLPAFCFNSKRFKDNYRKNENSELINLLPDSFTAEDVVKAQQRSGIACTTQNARVIISRLKGSVEPTGEPNHWRKVASTMDL